MSQRTVPDLLRECIRQEPGIASTKLWNIAKNWDHRLLGVEFDAGLEQIRQEGYRVTGRQWYASGASRPAMQRQPKVDPRQLRMFG